MTTGEAADYLRPIMNSASLSHYRQALKLALECLDKQTQKKAIEEKKMIRTITECSCCRCIYYTDSCRWMYDDIHKSEICERCALDMAGMDNKKPVTDEKWEEVVKIVKRIIVRKEFSDLVKCIRCKTPYLIRLNPCILDAAYKPVNIEDFHSWAFGIETEIMKDEPLANEDEKGEIWMIRKYIEDIERIIKNL